jgi:hypothetical protein
MHSGHYTIEKLTKRALNFLSLSDSESIKFHIKVGSQPVYINNIRKARTNLIITDENLILFDYYRFPIRRYTKWREGEIIPLSNIMSITAEANKYRLSPQPLISFNTSENDVYKIIFYRKKTCNRIFHEMVDLIMTVNKDLDEKITLEMES